MSKHVWKAVATAVALVAALAVPTHARQTADTAFTYQGRLSSGGVPVDGMVDALDYAVWRAAVGGTQVGPTLSFADVPVLKGVFAVELDFGAVFDGSPLWLEITVNGTPLSPRQPLTGAPMSVSTRGINVDAAGNVGIGTATPNTHLEVEAPEATMRVTSTDTSPTTTSRLQFSSATAPGIATTLGSIQFIDEAEALKAYISGVRVGSTSASLSLGVSPGELSEVHLVPGEMRLRGDLAISRRTDATNSAFIGTDGADSYFQVHGGFMGVGTDTPLNTLHVDGFVRTDGLVLPTSSGERSQVLHDFDDLVIANLAAGAIHFSTYPVPNAIARSMTITNDGNVGIGVLDPGRKLEVDGPAQASAYYLQHSSGVSTLYNVGADTYLLNGAAGALKFYTGPSVGVSYSAMTILDNGFVGIWTDSPAFRLHVNGSAGKPGGGSWSVASDRRLKTNIAALDGALDQLLQLRGVTFEYKDPDAINELSGPRIGMIAQDVEQVFPDWIDTRDDGYKSLTYRGFEALTVEAMRELREEKDAEIRMLRERIERLEELLIDKENES
ncbi:MAG: tail fiber domain-containing protein [Phycisphaerales bacterium]|nr:tail fiber domain-containing protein [Phycisphaerales bacterium]